MMRKNPHIEHDHLNGVRLAAVFGLATREP
jgi:hypothetical protein